MRSILFTVVVFIGLIVILFGFSGCGHIQLHPIRNTDKQVEMIRKMVIDACKEGLYDGIMLTEPQQLEPEAQLMPWEDIEGLEQLPNAKPK